MKKVTVTLSTTCIQCGKQVEVEVVFKMMKMKMKVVK